MAFSKVSHAHPVKMVHERKRVAAIDCAVMVVSRKIISWELHISMKEGFHMDLMKVTLKSHDG